jgi:hypothetical protein
MFAGPTICGMPQSASLGFLSGWYAHNGVSLGNPKLGFVCVSEDMTGEFGLCGYFYEYDHDLEASERLRFEKAEKPPKFEAGAQPVPPVATWSAERLAKANRNYAIEYVRNGVCQLMTVLDRERVLTLTQRAARLIGLQYAQELADELGLEINSQAKLGRFMETLFLAMGDSVAVGQEQTNVLELVHTNLRITKGMDTNEAEVMLRAWGELFAGFGMAQQDLMSVEANIEDELLHWRISGVH